MSGHCEDCKYWSRKTVGQEDEMSETDYDPQRRCTLLSECEPDKGAGLLPMCLGYLGMVDITTGPTFGCVHFKARTAEGSPDVRTSLPTPQNPDSQTSRKG